MFPLLLISNRTYLKLPWYTLSRHLSTVERRIYEPFVLTTVHRNLWSNSIQINQWEVFTNEYYQKRYMILNTPSTTEEKSSSNKNERMPFQFPPGNPNDKPKLEHLCFIENQLIQILPAFFKQMHPYALYTADMIFENYYHNPPKIMKGAGSYALALLWIRTKLNFKLMNINVRLLKTTIDEELDCVKIRWRIAGLSNKSIFGILKGWRKPRDITGNVSDYIEYIDGFSTFYVRGDGRIYKHRVDRVMIDEDKELAASSLNKKKLPTTAPVSL